MKNKLSDINYTEELFNLLEKLNISEEEQGKLFENALEEARHNKNDGSIDKLASIINNPVLVMLAIDEQLQLDKIAEKFKDEYQDAKETIINSGKKYKA